MNGLQTKVFPKTEKNIGLTIAFFPIISTQLW